MLLPYLLIIISGTYVSLSTLPIIQPHIEILRALGFIATVLVVAHILSLLGRDFVGQYFQEKGKKQKTPQLFLKMMFGLIYLIALLIILSYLGVKIESLIVTLGVGGLAIGLALQGTLSNFFVGLHLVSDKPIRVGDFVELEGNITGYVEDIGWRSTRVRTLSNNIVIIPNTKLAESEIVNQSMPVLEVSIPIYCGVAYGSDLEEVQKVALDTAKKLQRKFPEIVKDYPPFFRYYEFGDSNINFKVFIRANMPEDQYRLRHEYIKMLKAAFDKNKIEISWPVRKLYKGA
ncbi:MAG: mechanosensitive ion channel family protein [Candidatus Aenigmatarchaeota archaeon]